MFSVKINLRWRLIGVRFAFGGLLVLFLVAAILHPSPACATVRNVVSDCGATGNGVDDDTPHINSCIALLQPGDTLLFPCGTYRTTAQLTVGVTDVTVDGSGCAIVKDTYSNSGTPTGRVMVIGGNGTSLYATYGPAVPLSAAAGELSTSFTTISSLGVGPGDYLYVCQGGVDGSATPGASCPQSASNGICDPSGCRGEILKVLSVSGNTVTVTTALHDTYDPVANSAVAQKIENPLSGIVFRNMTIDGNGTNAYGLVLAGVVYSEVTGVVSRNVQGAAVMGGGDFNVVWRNITITGAGSADCGAAAAFEQQGNLSLNGISISQENQQGPSGGGTCFVSAGAFGFALAGSANSTIANLTVDAAGAKGRPFKFTAGRWNVLNSLTVQNGSSVDDNGITLQYYSSHNTFNDCAVTQNGIPGDSGTAGINLFGNYNQFNIFENCTVSGNAGVQFADTYFDRLQQGTDSHNAVVGGSYTGTNGAGSVINLEAPYDSVSGVTISGPAPVGYSGLEMDGPNGLGAPGGTSVCVNNNVFLPGNPPLTYAISSYNSDHSDVGSGNQLGSLNNNPNGNFTPGTCAAP